MIDTLGICDTSQSIECINQLSNSLHINRLIRFEECTVSITREYKIILFVLNPENIGNSIFLNKIREILQVRKSKKSIYFIIDGMERLDLKERFKVSLELEKALQKDIEYPQIIMVSLLLASTYEAYQLGRVTLDDIQKDKRITLLDEYSYTVTGKALTQEYLQRFVQESKIDHLVTVFREQIPKFEQVDVERNCWAILGNKGSGKTTFKEVFETLFENISLIEINQVEALHKQVIEGVILILDLNHESNKKLLSEMKKLAHSIPLVILINHIDNYVNESMLPQELDALISQYCVSILNQKPTASISSYYAQMGIALEEEKISIDDIISDPQILLIDGHGLPIIKYKNREQYKELFNRQNYITQIKKIGDKICSNHL